MKYLVDTHSLDPKRILAEKRMDVCVIQEVIDESVNSEDELASIQRSGVQILQLGKVHLEVMKDIMAIHGWNTKLIRLLASKGSADVSMLAFIIGERDMPSTLFNEREYILVTKDKALREVAALYGIECADSI